MKRILLILALLLTGFAAWAQKPGTVPVRVSQEKQMMNGRKFYVHIVEKGQTVYSIARAYRVESFDAVTHVDIHSLQPGDTVWLPFRGQFTESEERAASAPAPAPVPVEKVYVRDTVYVNVPYAVHDTMYVNVPYAVHDTTVVTNTVTEKEYVTLRDTLYINVPYAVHDTTVVTNTVTETEYVTVRDTAYINVPYAVHDTTVVTNTVTETEYVPVRDTMYVTVRDTAYINVPYAVHDTTVVTNTVTEKEYVTVRDTMYVTVRDTAYINVPYAVHDTTVVTNTVTEKEYVTVRDTTYINVPYAVHDTTVVTNTVTEKEYVPVRDTLYITVRDTAYINVPYAVHDTTVVTNTLTEKEYVPVRDTLYVTVRDTAYINVPYAVHDTMSVDVAVHDTTYVNVPYAVHDTVVVTNTVTQTEYVPVHDTTYITLRDTVRLTEYVSVNDTTYITARDTVYIDAPYAVHDTTVVTNTVTEKEYVTVRDTTYINVPYAVHDTVTVTQTEYVTVRDTAYVTVHDTIHIDAPYAVHDTTYINVPYAVHDSTIMHDTVKLTEYVTVHDTAYIKVPYAVHDSTIVTDTVRLTEYVTVHDTAYIKVPYAVHDTMYIVDTMNYAPTSSSALAFASASPVALPGYVQDGPFASSDSPAMEESQRKVGKVLKVAVMMPLHLDQLDQISTSKFDIEQRGKRSYRQFEFIEFYEGLLMALDKLAEQGVSVDLNVVDVSENSPAKVEEAFRSHHVEQSDFVVALLLRDCFDKAAELARQAGVYIVNPMATRSELCAENPYMVKIQPSMSGMITLALNNMKFERPNGHLYIIHSGSAAEKPVMDELKRQLTERGDIKYTLFNWSQSARLASVLKATPNCHVLSIYDQNKDENRVFSINLLNRLSSIKKDSPTLYTLTDWTREYGDIDYGQLQLLCYHTFSLAWNMANEVHVEFLKTFRTRFGNEPTSQLAATGYDLMLYVAGGLARRSSDFWRQPGNSLPTLVQPLHLVRSGAGLENDKAQLYRLEELHFVKALYK